MADLATPAQEWANDRRDLTRVFFVWPGKDTEDRQIRLMTKVVMVVTLRLALTR